MSVISEGRNFNFLHLFYLKKFLNFLSMRLPLFDIFYFFTFSSLLMHYQFFNFFSLNAKIILQKRKQSLSKLKRGKHLIYDEVSSFFTFSLLLLLVKNITQEKEMKGTDNIGFQISEEYWKLKDKIENRIKYLEQKTADINITKINELVSLSSPSKSNLSSHKIDFSNHHCCFPCHTCCRLKKCTLPIEEQPIRDSFEEYISLNQIVKNNLQIQKQNNENIKTLADKISEFSSKKNISHGFLDHESAKNISRLPEKPLDLQNKKKTLNPDKIRGNKLINENENKKLFSKRKQYQQSCSLQYFQRKSHKKKYRACPIHDYDDIEAQYKIRAYKSPCRKSKHKNNRSQKNVHKSASKLSSNKYKKQLVAKIYKNRQKMK